MIETPDETELREIVTRTTRVIDRLSTIPATLAGPLEPVGRAAINSAFSARGVAQLQLSGAPLLGPLEDYRLDGLDIWLPVFESLTDQIEAFVTGRPG